MRVMQIAPHTKDDWIALVLLPAKVFLVVILIWTIGGYPLGATQEANRILGICGALSVPFLLFGALVQSIFCRRGSASHTLLFLGFLCLSVYLGGWTRGGILIPLVCWMFWRLARLVRHSAPTSTELTGQIECLDCHAIIPAGESRCPHCGWTFKI
jgi:hypothetical protein